MAENYFTTICLVTVVSAAEILENGVLMTIHYAHLAHVEVAAPVAFVNDKMNGCAVIDQTVCPCLCDNQGSDSKLCFCTYNYDAMYYAVGTKTALL